MSETLHIKDGGRGLGSYLHFLSLVDYLGLNVDLDVYTTTEDTNLILINNLIRIFNIQNVTYRPIREEWDENKEITHPFLRDHNKFFSTYLDVKNITIKGREEEIGKSKKRFILLACYHNTSPTSIFYSLDSNNTYPKNKHYPFNTYQHFFRLIREAGFDVITLDNVDLPIEDKIKFLNDHVACVIGYQGGLMVLAHILKIPTIIFPWRLTNFVADTKSHNSYDKYPWLNSREIYSHSFHLVRSSYVTGDYATLFKWNAKFLLEVIDNLKNNQGNNKFLTNYDFNINLTQGLDYYYLTSESDGYIGELRPISEIADKKVVEFILETKGELKVAGEIPISLDKPTNILNRNYFPIVISPPEAPTRESVSFNYKWLQGKFFYSHIDFLTLEEGKFFYLEFLNAEAFRYKILPELIDFELLDKIKTLDNYYLILSNAHEAYHNVVDGIYKFLVIENNIPANKIILISMSPDIDKEVDFCARRYHVGRIRVFSFDEYHYTASCAANHIKVLRPDQYNFANITLHKSKYDKKYIFLNGIMRPHRSFIISYLHSRGYVKDGYVSYNSLGDNNSNRYPVGEEFFYLLKKWAGGHMQWNNFLNEHRLSIEGIKPIYLDTDELTQRNMGSYTSADKTYYENTYFSIISETLAFIGYSCDGFTGPGRCISEKTYKAILNKHPFILLGRPQSLRLLHDHGYKTFHPFIDENYDSVENDAERMWLITKEIDKLINLDATGLSQFLEFAKPIVEHNLHNLAVQSGPWMVER